MEALCLGIDTSAYTTSAAVSANGKILHNEKLPLEVKEGERGLRQSDAVFAHIKNLPVLIERIRGYKFTAVGYSARPRDIEGSYMPCFEAGAAFAKSLSSICGVPVYPFSHQAGHIKAALYSSQLSAEEFLAFHISGGTTELLHVAGGKITLLGGTLDLNAGQAVDRIGVMLGLSFPCGAGLEALAEDTETAERDIKISVSGFGCNLSGVENRAKKMLCDGRGANEIAAYTLDFVKYTICAMTEEALKVYSGLPVLYAGGVMSCRRIRDFMTDRFDAYFAKPEYSCDNAAGTALLCEEKYSTEDLVRQH